jgi:hypothetical protein
VGLEVGLVAASAPRRTLLASNSGLHSFSRVYRTADAIEVDEIEGTDVTRRRVLLEEILLVTHHREYGTAFVVTTAALFTVATAFSGLVAVTERTAGLVLFALTGLPVLLALALRLVLGLDVVTVFGRRTKAVLRFSLRKARARETFRLVCRVARERQERLARERARAGPPAVPATPATPGDHASSR